MKKKMIKSFKNGSAIEYWSDFDKNSWSALFGVSYDLFKSRGARYQGYYILCFYILFFKIRITWNEKMPSLPEAMELK